MINRIKSLLKRRLEFDKSKLHHQESTWNERIAKAKQRGRFTLNDQRSAMSWPSCKIGEFKEKFPEQFNYRILEPESERLKELGTLFAASVFANDIEGAEGVAKEIELYFDSEGVSLRPSPIYRI